MYIMYATYSLGIYVGFAGLAIIALPGHSNPSMGAFAYLFLFPLLVVGLGFEVMVSVPQNDRETITLCIVRGTISRPCAAGVGFTVGILTCICILLLGYSAWLIEILWIRIILIILCVLGGALGPGIGIVWLLALCSRNGRIKSDNVH